MTVLDVRAGVFNAAAGSVTTIKLMPFKDPNTAFQFKLRVSFCALKRLKNDSLYNGDKHDIVGRIAYELPTTFAMTCELV